MTVEIGIEQLGREFGVGAVVGAIVGFATKKIAKLIAVIIGIEIVLFRLLESRGIIQVNWDRIEGSFLGASDVAMGASPPSWLVSIASTLSIGAGFVGGFILGFKYG
tara:strand:- start:1549 stop:1869 length:321 start_codon:yes stop_codon:yes gene_type:complete